MPGYVPRSVVETFCYRIVLFIKATEINVFGHEGNDIELMTPPTVIVVLDSLRRDHVGWYGNDWIDTSAIDEFAAHPDTVTFTEAYPEALPTIPARSGLMTGQRTLPYRPWQALEDEDITVAELLRKNGYVTGLVSDTYHMNKPGMNFHQGFDGFRWIRGQEADAYRTAPPTVDLESHMKPAMQGSLNERLLEQYLRNIADRDDDAEEEFFAARVFDEATDWVERNRDHDPFFLWVDSFDPHEPWDPPVSYRGRHADPDYDGPELIDPKYGSIDWLTDEELEHVRGRYAEEVEFVDARLGRFFDALREENLYEDSLIVLLSDHGVQHGEHGSIGKPPGDLYGEVVEVPLLVKPPAEVASERDFRDEVDALVQTNDVAPTLLDLVGFGREAEAMQGSSLVPVMTGERDAVRDAVVTGYHGSEYRCVRDGTWSYIHSPEGERDELYYLDEDPAERNNVVDEYPEVVDRLSAHLGSYITASQTGPMSPNDVKTVQERYESGTDEDEDGEVANETEERLRNLGYFE